MRTRSIGIKGDESQLGPCDNFYESIEFRGSDVKIHYPLSKTAALRYDAVTSSLPASSVAHGSVITMNNITYEGKIAADSRIVLENVSTYDSKNRESEEIYQRIQFGCFDFKELFVMNASCFQRKASTLIHSGSAIIQSHYPTAASTASTSHSQQHQLLMPTPASHEEMVEKIRTLEEETRTLYLSRMAAYRERTITCLQRHSWRTQKMISNGFFLPYHRLRRQHRYRCLSQRHLRCHISHIFHISSISHISGDKGRHNREDKGRNNIGDLGRNSRGDKGRHNRGDLGRNNSKDKGRHNSKG
ncbi:hypothetical protein OROHE_017273 [Orobanche hederae]